KFQRRTHYIKDSVYQREWIHLNENCFANCQPLDTWNCPENGLRNTPQRMDDGLSPARGTAHGKDLIWFLEKIVVAERITVA
ncbi:MAG: hypothetical protein ACKOJF_18285, partial [Planctomycetaceae bacterium]